MFYILFKRKYCVKIVMELLNQTICDTKRENFLLNAFIYKLKIDAFVNSNHFLTGWKGMVRYETDLMDFITALDKRIMKESV